MRRLPVYFLIDVSESMVGEPVELVQEGISTIVKDLRTDPYALETVYVSVIAFAGKALKVTPMIELYSFYPPKLPIGGGTSLGNALTFLMSDIETTVQKTTLEQKGDWKPIIFLFTDGNPTDNFDPTFDRWNHKYRTKTNLVAISLGQNTDNQILGRITDNVLQLKNTDAESFRKFFKWVTASIKTSSTSIADTKQDGLFLAPVTNGYLAKIDLTKMDLTKKPQQKSDDQVAVLLAKCQKTKRHYLIKYERRISASEFKELNYNTLDYKLAGAYPIDQSYFDLTDNNQDQKIISTSELTGFPICPCCGNQYGFSYCSCGKIICSGDEEVVRCPWCNNEARFQTGDGNINVTKTRG